MVGDLRRQTINDLTNAALSARRLARACREKPRNSSYRDESLLADQLTDAADTMIDVRTLLETTPV